MSGKKFLTFVLLLNTYIFFIEAQKPEQCDVTFDTSSPKIIASQAMTYFFTLEEIAKPYCQKYSTVLPIWCNTCKKRKLHLGEFSGCILALLLKNVNDQKETKRLALIFDNFLKILTTPKPQESTMVDFIVKEMKKIDYPCTECHSNAWEKIPKDSKSTKPSQQ